MELTVVCCDKCCTVIKRKPKLEFFELSIAAMTLVKVSDANVLQTELVLNNKDLIFCSEKCMFEYLRECKTNPITNTDVEFVVQRKRPAKSDS